MRRKFDQYVNFRPAYCSRACPARCGTRRRQHRHGGVRENTEGSTPRRRAALSGTPADVAVQTAVFTRRGCERIIRAAFEYARKRPRKKVTSITKSNALTYSMVLWGEAFAAVRAEYMDVQANYLLVDAAAMDFVRRPEAFDVVVASNLFGDILTDLSSIIVGSIGLAASGNINPEKKYPSLFEPIHGSAPDIVGKGIANPLAAILSAGLMLDHLGLAKSAAAIRSAFATVLRERKALPPDLGGTAKTAEVADAVLAALRN